MNFLQLTDESGETIVVNMSLVEAIFRERSVTRLFVNGGPENCYNVRETLNEILQSLPTPV